MAKNLVIVESPTKAKSIKKMLGRNYKVVASVGHIRDLPKSTLGVDVENNFEPKYINIRGKGDLIKSLKKEAKDADNILLATDPDREGEAISWHLCHILGIRENEKCRITFNEITPTTVKKQIIEPRVIDMNLVDAQQARRVLDRLVGYKIRPLLWKKVKSGLSAGRAQSVTLKLICDKESEIEEFIPEEYWTIEGNLKKSRSNIEVKYIGRLKNNKLESVDLKNEKDADIVLKNVDKNKFIVRSIDEGSRTRTANLPFTTSTMQQEASKRLNFSSKKTMMVAQKLYEGIEIPKRGSVGLITYMRTDSTRMSEDARNALISYIEKEFGKEYLNTSGIKKANSKNIQDAHECIRPTDVTLSPYIVKDSLTKDEFKLYSLIWKRFVASQMQQAKYKTLTVDIISNDEIFRTSGSTMIFDGFLRVYDFSSNKDKILPEMVIGENLKFVDMNKIQHFTAPPARYTEASLIKKLEDLGIGRPSTYAPIVTTLLSRYYVVIEEKKLLPTELGILVNDLLVEYFRDLVNEDFTASLESDLDRVAEGDIKWKNLINEFYKTLKKDLDKAEKIIEKVDIKDEETDEICEKCGRHMVIKMGRFGKFLACPGFPECHNAKPLIEKVGVKCPKCGGDIVVRRSKKGRKFYGCENYPKCDFTTWNEPVEKKCPICGKILTKVAIRNKEFLKCSDNNCSYREEIEDRDDK